MIEIQQLFLYPIKSVPGISVDSIVMTTVGPKYDRQYMLVDERKRFITQRTHPVLSQFSIQRQPSGWQVSAADGTSVYFSDDEYTENSLQTKVWKTELQVREKSVKVSRWFSEHLDQLVRLVELDGMEIRYREVQGRQSALQFADGYPLLICNQQSLDQLSQTVSHPLQMARFRPNVVVSVDPWSEHFLSKLTRHDGGEILIGCLCERCNIPAIDPITGVFHKALHVTMKAALKQNGKVIFGVNAASKKLNALHVGDVFKPSHILEESDSVSAGKC